MANRTIELVYDNQNHLQVTAESVLEGDEAHNIAISEVNQPRQIDLDDPFNGEF